MNKFHIYILLLFISLSCDPAVRPKEQFLKRVQKGAVLDNIVCKIAPGQSYCLYLPTSYSVKKTYPVIFAFDSHGSGRLPVELMKNAAEESGYILVGSNDFHNGLGSDEMQDIANNLLIETKQNLSIDTLRMYTAGFSGGARFACAVAQYNYGIRGVIACSAGFQPGNNAPGFHFIGIAGTQDMNYLEMKRLDEKLESMNARHQLLIFEGKHQWPPEVLMHKAITLLDLYAMKDKLQPVNKKSISTFESKNTQDAKHLMETKSPDSLAKACLLLKQSIGMLDGLTDVGGQKTILTNLQQQPEVQNYFNAELSLEKYEFQKQQELVAAFESKPSKWWQAQLAEFEQISKENGAMKNVAKRLLGYVSLSCYSYVNRALQTQNWKAAELYTGIYQQADPENTECYYDLACLKANTGKTDDAIVHLQKAIQLGFHDITRLQNDPLLKTLHGLPAFEEMLKK